MKAAIVEKVNQLVLKEIPDLPEPGDYQCICKNLYASACTGTDKKIIHNKLPWGSNFPAVLGHEVIGEVISTGSKVTSFEVGDLVLRPVYVYPGETRNGYGAEFGGFSEFGLVDDIGAARADDVSEDKIRGYCKFQMKVPRDWKEFPEAVLLITMKETFSFIKKQPDCFGKRVAVVGAGVVGMFYMRFAAMFGASEVVAIARSKAGAERAIAAGADTFVALGDGMKPEGQFDLIIDAAGIMEQINEYVPLVKKNGTLAIYGVSAGMGTSIEGFGSGINISFKSPTEDDQTIHDACVSLVEKSFIDLEIFRSSIMPFNQIVEGFKAIENKTEFKPIFKFN
jgi:threonine dehydrogenase-like Zn-dependent dehydrogenase